MLADRDFVRQSLDINLFFLRVLKEHSLFLAVSFPPKNANLTMQALVFKQTFENLMLEAISLAYGRISIKNDAVTSHTYEAEKATEFLSGIPLNTNLTLMELGMQDGVIPEQYLPFFVQRVYDLNSRSLAAAQAIVAFKTMVLTNVLNCTLATTNYPLLIDHIRREGVFYIDILNQLQNRVELNVIQDAIRQEIFWNQIMAEHAKFIRGFLDPTEEALIQLANNFGNQFDELTRQALAMTEQVALLAQVTDESLALTKEFKEFKEQGAVGILNCKIRALIAPILADHVLREANHYLILLTRYDGISGV